jgi:hypothetical protein
MLLADHFRLWHEPDQLGRSDDVRCSGETGSGDSGPSGPVFEPISDVGSNRGGVYAVKKPVIRLGAFLSELTGVKIGRSQTNHR